MTFEEKLKELLQVGGLHRHSPTSGYFASNSANFAKWRMRAERFLIQYLGSGHPYTLEFDAHVAHVYEKETTWDESWGIGLGILEALQEDYENGHIKIQEHE